MMYMCCRQRSGYTDDYKPRVSEIECSCLKSKHDIETEKNRKGKMITLIEHQSSQFHTLCINSTRMEVCASTKLCLCRTSRRVKMTVHWLYQQLFLSLLCLLRCTFETRVPVMGFSLDMNPPADTIIAPVPSCPVGPPDPRLDPFKVCQAVVPPPCHFLYKLFFP